MQIIKNRALVHSDWLYPAFETAATEDEPVQSQPIDGTLFGYRDWLSLDAATKAAIKGLVLQPDDEVVSTSADLQNIELIGIYFPTFTEGRGYTQAAILRNQLDFKGELRAINVYRDNLVLLEEVGFDAFDINETEDVSDALLAFGELDLATA